ncbi:MAG: hypothetical protein FJ290_06210 [Planctomycetes bacterium]|nr:hypothetical protein [Planctomycetota bacterium]
MRSASVALVVTLLAALSLPVGRACAAEGRPPTLEEELATARAEIEQLRKALAEKEKEIAELQNRLVTRQRELANALNEIERFVRDLHAANGLLSRIKESYPEIDPTRLLPPAQARRPQKPIEAKVTGVDKQLGLVIINKGQRHGVRKGNLIEVFRDKKRVVRVVVDEVFPDMSACHYDPRATDGAVEVGDDAATPQEDPKKPKESEKPPE